MRKRIYISENQIFKLRESLSNNLVDKDEFTIGDDGNGNLGYMHIEESYNTSQIDIDSIDKVEYSYRVEYEILAWDDEENEIYNDSMLSADEVLKDFGTEISSIIINKKGDYDADYDCYTLSNIKHNQIKDIEYHVYNLYDIILYDIDGNILYQEDGMYFDEIQKKFGENIASMIVNHEGYFSQGSYIISDLMSYIKVDINNVDEVNALAKKMFTSYSSEYSGQVHGWLLTDGTILDFGANIDHLSINKIDGMTLGKFEDLGNIRIGDDSFELCKYPTQEQKNQLRKLIAVNKEVYVDICSYKRGNYPNTITSARYYNPSFTRIMGQIYQFFNDGIQLRGYSELDENVQLEVEPNDVDLSSFEIQMSLNSDIWKSNGQIDSRVRLNLLDIADDFYDSLKLKWLKPCDIILTGSICNFNWSEFSDIDLHIVVDLSQISDNLDLVREYVNTKKNEWNNEHENITIHGFNVEVFIEDINDDTVSEGIYSLQTNKWLKTPKKRQIKPISSRASKIKKVAADVMTQIDDIEEDFNSINDLHELDLLEKKIDSLIKNIGKIRKDGLSSEMKESSLGNILYKILRRMHYLDKIWEIKIAIYDKKHSIN